MGENTFGSFLISKRMEVSVKPPRGLNCGSGHETISQNLKYLSCSPREVFDTLGDGQKWSKVCK